MKTEDVSPSVSFKTITQPLRPSENKIRCLMGPRDQLPEGRQIYGLELKYTFNVVSLACSKNISEDLNAKSAVSRLIEICCAKFIEIEIN